jgi:hypothetical protein
LWPDSSGDDYIHHPKCIEEIWSYEMAMRYKRFLNKKVIKCHWISMNAMTIPTQLKTMTSVQLQWSYKTPLLQLM